jgi:hypothetical protein
MRTPLAEAERIKLKYGCAALDRFIAEQRGGVLVQRTTTTRVNHLVRRQVTWQSRSISRMTRSCRQKSK